MIILHNPNSKESRLFVKLFSGQASVIDWYGDHAAREKYLALGYPHPGQFPVAVDENSKVSKNKARKYHDLRDEIDKLPPHLRSGKTVDKIIQPGNETSLTLDIGSKQYVISMDRGEGVLPAEVVADVKKGRLEPQGNKTWKVVDATIPQKKSTAGKVKVAP